MKKLLITLILFICSVVSAYGSRYAVVDIGTMKAFIYDNNTLITTTDFSSIGRPYFIRDAGDSGWLIKLMPDQVGHDLFEMYHLDVDGTLGTNFRHSSIYNSPGLYYTGIKGGNVVTAKIYQGELYVFDIQGGVVASHDVWNDPSGWSYNYNGMGDVAGLTGGGLVVLPEQGSLWASGRGYTPYIYFYDDSMSLIHKKDISPLGLFLYAITGLSSGGFVGIGNYGGGDYITHLFYFDVQGNLFDQINITSDIPALQTKPFLAFTVSAINDGGVIVSEVGGDSFYLYHSPPVEVELSGDGITNIGGVGGNYMQTTADNDYDNDGILNDLDNCPNVANSDQEDFDDDGEGDICDDDIDGDGVLNDDDNECGFTPVDEIVDPSNGCSIEQLVPCDEDWKNHGKYVSALAKTTNGFVEQGLITEEEKDDLMEEMASSDCGK